MTVALNGVTKNKATEHLGEPQAATELVQKVTERRLSLTGPGGLLKQLTRR